MPRPKNNRIVHQPPFFTEFRPFGRSDRSTEKIILNLDEFEAIRLADLIGMSHEKAAAEMEISRPTFSRLIEKSRKKMAEFIFYGKSLRIYGGNIHFRRNIIQCVDCGHMYNLSVNETMTQCPECYSKNLLNLAGGFGHGECCRVKY
jgi:predicted DNA-binding protein (UPF0251 family)